jgi:hypothetical protein
VNKHKRPQGYQSAEKANVTLDRNKEDNDIEIIMCGLCLPTETGNDIQEKVTLNDIVLTDEYADVIITETAVTNKPIEYGANDKVG